MRRLAWLSLAATVVVAALIGSEVSLAQSTDTYELDVVVTDRDNKPVMDLRQEDFQITDDGKKVTPTSFTKVALQPGEGRTMIIVLDDTATAKATESIQTLATTLLQTSSPTGGDRISVIRLSTKSDNVAFDVQTVRTRLAGFQAGSIPFAVGQTTEELLDLITRISPELAEPKSRRKAIVCVGAPGVCSMRQRSQNIERPALWTNWVNGVTALGKNNISLYAFMPVPKAVGDGALTDFSGGTGFTTAADFTPFARQIWSELSNYYMIGYKAEPTNKDLRNISVKVSKGGMKIHARQLRGK